MFCTIKSESKHLNLKRIQFSLTWFKVPMKFIPINLKWSTAMICYNKPALGLKANNLVWVLSTGSLWLQLLYNLHHEGWQHYKCTLYMTLYTFYTLYVHRKLVSHNR